MSAKEDPQKNLYFRELFGWALVSVVSVVRVVRMVVSDSMVERGGGNGILEDVMVVSM